jgi:glycosyltransferase involved in cell wall biosynthesis
MALQPPPLISIVIPTYEMKGHGVVFLEHCLFSIQKQTGFDNKDVEIIISDHSSDQAIASFCHSLGNKQIHYHRTTTGKGIAAHNLNAGINLARGSYIKILFQDDILVQDFYLKTTMDLIKLHTPSCILSAASHTKDGQSFFNPIVPSNNPYLLFGNNTVSSPSTLTASKKFLQEHPFDENLKLLFDCDFYYRIFEQSQNIIIDPEIFIANGVWEGQTQFSISQKQFSQEVRYLNWKYPKANLTQLLVSYGHFFTELHPTAPFPFNQKLVAKPWEKLYWKLTRRQI